MSFLWWPRLKPFGMTGLAEKLGFVVAPSLNGALGVLRKNAAAGALEFFLFRLPLREKLADQGKRNKCSDNDSDNDFRRHLHWHA